MFCDHKLRVNNGVRAHTVKDCIIGCMGHRHFQSCTDTLSALGPTLATSYTHHHYQIHTCQNVHTFHILPHMLQSQRYGLHSCDCCNSATRGAGVRSLDCPESERGN